jgi:hypothetical protein
MGFAPVNTGSLPELYDRWISELLKAPLPEEPESTCTECAMCSTNKIQRTKLDHQFNDATKCCTIFPKIPNFLAGKILLDQDPESTTGRLRFLGQMHVFTLVTPLGVLPPPGENSRYGALTGTFGHDIDLRCPYYIDTDGGLCGIWKHRNAKCATFFCKHTRGQTGLYFWRALKDLLQQIEETLSIWCIHELKVGNEDFRRIFPIGQNDLETFNRQSQFYYSISKNDIGLSKQVWGKWFGKERSFLEECSHLTDSFTWQFIQELEDPRILRASAFLQSCFNNLQDFSVPEFLKLGSFQSCEINEEKIRLWGYSQYDPIDVPVGIFELLKSFDGSRPSGLSAEWIRRLCDFGIFV